MERECGCVYEKRKREEEPCAMFHTFKVRQDQEDTRTQRACETDVKENEKKREKFTHDLLHLPAGQPVGRREAQQRGLHHAQIHANKLQIYSKGMLISKMTLI